MTMHVEVGHDKEQPNIIGIVVREGDAQASAIIPMPMFHLPAIKAFVEEINAAFEAIDRRAKELATRDEEPGT